MSPLPPPRPPLALKRQFTRVPIPSTPIHPNRRGRFRIKITAGKSGHALAHFDEAFSVAIKRVGTLTPEKSPRNRFRHNFALSIRKDAGFGQWFPESKGNTGYISNRKDIAVRGF